MNKNKMRINNNFDFLRLFASLLVLISHQFPLGGRLEPKIFEHNLGVVAVFIFFIISGYWVTKSYQKENSVKIFIAKRMLRIFPALFVCIIVCYFIIGPIGFSGNIKSYFLEKEYYNFFKNLYFVPALEFEGIFTNNPHPNIMNGSLWTLPIEFKWYLILCLFGYFKLINKKVIFLVLLTSILFYIYKNYYSYETKDIKNFFYLGNFFLCGIFLALVKLNNLVLVLAFLFSISLLVVKFYYLALIIGLPPLIIFIGTKSFKYLNQTYKIGDLSYGIFLFAFPIQQTLYYFFISKINFSIIFMLTIFITITFAYISWKFIEKPALNFKKKLYFEKI